MKESFFRRLLGTIIDRQERADLLAKCAAVIAGLTAFALALAPMLYSTASVSASRQAVHASAPAANTGAKQPAARPPEELPWQFNTQ